MLIRNLSFIILVFISFSGCSKPKEIAQDDLNTAQQETNQSTKLSTSETRSDLISKTVDTEWKDPKTGLTWLKCSIGQELVNGVCIKENITENSTLKKIQDNIQGNLYTTDDSSYLLTYSQAEQAISYLNSQSYKGKNNWRLPTIFEISALRTCVNSSDYLDDMVQIYDGSKLISVPYKCENDKDNVLNSIIPVDTSVSGWYNLNIWTSTSAGESSKYGNPASVMWTTSLSAGRNHEYNVDGAQGVILVRDAK